MKPEELLEHCGETLYAQVETKRILDRYSYQNCVIAYDKNKLGVIFIIKGKTKYFGFISLKENISLGGQEYQIGRTNLGKTLSLLGDDCIIIGRTNLGKTLSLLGDDCIILDKKEFSKVKKEIIMENL